MKIKQMRSEDRCEFDRAFVNTVTKLEAVYIPTMYFSPSNSLFCLFQRVAVTATGYLDSPHGKPASTLGNVLPVFLFMSIMAAIALLTTLNTTRTYGSCCSPILRKL